MCPTASSLWQSEVLTPFLPLEQDRRCRTLVVGAGLVGAALARDLTRAGEDVLLVDSHGPGQGASGRNAGFVLCCHPVAWPELRAHLGRERAHAFLALTRRNRERIAMEFGDAVQFRQRGCLLLAHEDDAAEQERLARACELLAGDGIRIEETAVPATTHGFGMARLVADDGEVHPMLLMQALIEEVADAALAPIASIDAEARTATCADGTLITFDRCVVTTNALASRLLPSLKDRITPQRAQALATEPLPERGLERPTYASDGFDYFRQRDDGRLVLGGRRHLFREEEATDDPNPSDALQEALDGYIERHLPFARGARVTHRWAGTMGFTDTGLPVVEQVAPGLHVAAGFTGHGLGLALGLAELLTRKLTRPRDLRDYQARQLSVFES